MLYFRYVATWVRASMQYPMGFLFGALSTALTTVSSFLAIGLLFSRFGTIVGYSFGEVALCFAVASMGYAGAECIARGFDTFSGFIVRGDFDRLLLRPRSLLLQVFGARFEIARIGRVLFALAVLIIVCVSWPTPFTIAQILVLLGMVAGSILLFMGLFILTSALCFFTVQGLEVVNILTDGGREIASYPLSIYPKFVRVFFTFIIPFGAVNYLPLLYLTGRGTNPLYGLLPLITLPFCALCCVIWLRASRRYLSTGS